MKKFIIGCLVMSLPVVLFAASTIQSVMKITRQKFVVPAMSVSVVYPNGHEVDYTSGYQTLSRQKLVTPKMLYQVGSLTKTFTAALILQFQKEGKLKLSDSVAKYLPQYPKWRDITIKQLLNQTSGIFDYIDLPGWFAKLNKAYNKQWTLTELANLAYAHKSSFQVGTSWQYSNSNYVVAGLIIEKVTHQSIKSLIKSRLFRPNHLVHSHYVVTDFNASMKSKLVHGYFYNQVGKPYDMTFQNTSWLGSAGGITSNPHDMARWIWRVLGGKVLTRQELKQAQSVVSPHGLPHVSNLSQAGYGLAYFRMNSPVGLMWLTPGLTSGYRSVMSYLPCYNISMAYSLSTSDMYHHGSAKYILMHLYHVILSNRKMVAGAPKYCYMLKKPKTFSGLKAFFEKH